MTPEELLDEHTPDVVALAEELRALVAAVMPNAEERVYAGWHGFGYVDPDAGYVCAIFPMAESVRLSFEYGHRLEGHADLFTGGATQVRYIDLVPGEEYDAELLGDVILDAYELQAEL